MLSDLAQVNWQTLWMSWSERDFRGIITLLPLAILIVFPIGLFSGKPISLSIQMDFADQTLCRRCRYLEDVLVLYSYE